jgi:integrase
VRLQRADQPDAARRRAGRLAVQLTAVQLRIASSSRAVNNLRAWFAAGEDAGALLPVLQAYLGHSSIGDTAYYLRLTAESYPQITARVQRELGGIVPPLTGGQADGH